MIPRTLLVVLLVGCVDAEPDEAPEADTAAAARLSAGTVWQYPTNVNPATVGSADLNNDGRLDLVLGREGTPGGAVLVFLGKATAPRFAATPDGQFNVNEASSGLAEEQLVLGDFNCDGKVDAAVGVSGASSGEAGEGLVFVYAGNGDGTFADRSATPAATWVLQPNVVNESIGVHLAAYDANHDGCTDLLVPGASQLRGALGSAAGPSFTTSWTLLGAQTDVASAGDLNADGHEDFAWWDASYGSGAGQVVVFLGTGTGFPAASYRTIVGASGAALGGYTNTAGVTAGDVDRDGYDDLVIGAPGGNGRIDVYRGGASGVAASPTWSVPGPNDGIFGLFGMAVVSGFDQNADGYADLLVGEPLRDQGTLGYRGRWWLVVGSPAGPMMANPASWTSTREGKLGAYGRHAWTFGDLDNDGYDDVVLEDVGLTTIGAVDAATQLLTGGPDVDTDGDGWLDPADCAPTNLAIHPGASELYGNLVDEDCTGSDDCLADVDQDKFGSKVVVANPSGGCSSLDREAAVGGDCDDTNPNVRPGGSEQIGDGVDGDCNGGDLCYLDADSDTYGISTTKTSLDLSCAHPWLASVAGDCDDLRADVYPGALELIASGVDENCDGNETCALDKDGDRHGDPTLVYVTSDVGCTSTPASLLRDDCDDTNAKVGPGAYEAIADGFDADCDGVESCYVDGDGDGQGTPNAAALSSDLSCTHPGLSGAPGDCNDAAALIYKGAFEVPNDGIDQSCDGNEMCPADQDGDGHAHPTDNANSGDLSCGFKSGGLVRDDCDDSLYDVHPGGSEYTGDGIDGDCNGYELCYPDADGDGWGVWSGVPVASKDFTCSARGTSQYGKDCNDANALAFPLGTEVPADGVDENCDGVEVCYDDNDGDGWGTDYVHVSKFSTCLGPSDASRSGDCDDKNGGVNPGAIDPPHDGKDQNCDKSDACLRDGDGDGYGGTTTLDNGDGDCDDPGEVGVGGDCSDVDGAIYPGAVDATNDGIDGDCDGLDTCYVDSDNDGAGGTATAPGPMGCKGVGVAPLPNDCDDALTTVHPGGIDLPGDTIDQDCDGKLTCYMDADGDGSGGASVGKGASCSSAGLAPTDDDCNDQRADIHPGAAEVGGDGVDQDCSGLDGCYVDGDGDDFGSKEVAASGKSCAGYAVRGGDCDDANAAVNPGEAEVIGDERDNDCDGTASCYVDADHDQWGGAVSMIPGGGAIEPVYCDSWGRAEVGGDCDEAYGSIHPDAVDQAGRDNNCDGVASCFADLDGDDFGGAMVPFDVPPGDSVDCEVDGLAGVGDDCDDREPTARPGGTEIVGDAIDQDCTGLIHCYVDVDNDGFGSSVVVAAAVADCEGPGVATVDGDCQDLNADVSPSAVEICDGLDNNCTGRPDEGYPWVDLTDPEGTCANTHVPFCGCASAGTPATAGLTFLFGLLLQRRRRRV